MTTKELEERYPNFDRPDPNKMYSNDFRVRQKYRKERYGF